MRFVELASRLRELAVLAALAGCATAPVTKLPAAPEPAFAPRLVRQLRTDGLPTGTDASGQHWEAVAGGSMLQVRERGDGPVLLDAVLPDVRLASVSPERDFVCATLRTPRANAPTEVGVYDLGRQRWRWKETVIAPGVQGSVPWVLATPYTCAFVHRDHRDSVEVRAALDGRAVSSGIVEAPFTTAPQTARWTDDRLLVAMTSEEDTKVGPATLVELRDGQTLQRVVVAWARCVDVGTGVRVGLHEDLENAKRRAALERTHPEILAPCLTPPSPPPSPTPRLPTPRLPRPPTRSLPTSWLPLGPGVLAAHQESGLYVWDFGHLKAPQRVAGVPGPVRYRDVNGDGHPFEPTAPLDGSWVGVIRADGTLGRFSAATLAPLPEVSLPGVGAGVLAQPARTQWQVFAGARGKLLAVGTGSHGRVAFVGDVSGHWQQSPAQAETYLFQVAQHLDTAHAWLLLCPVRGLVRLDEETGAVTAAFTPPPTWSRFSAPLVSPDSTQVFVSVSSGAEKGLYVLDAASLRQLSRAPLEAMSVSPLAWSAAGVWLEVDPGLSDSRLLARFDPSTGSLSSVTSSGPPRELQRRWPTEVSLARADDGGGLTSSSAGAPDTWLGLVENGALLQRPDGRAWCAGAGCAQLACVVGPGDVRGATAPACASLLLQSP